MDAPLLTATEIQWLLRQNLPEGGRAIPARDGGQRALFGRGLEPELLRRYQYGDDVRRIDWAATLRFQRPMVRQTLPVAAGVLRIVIDTSLSMHVNSEHRYLMRRLVAAIGVVALAAGDRVEGYGGSEEAVAFVDVTRWLHWCATVSPQTTSWQLPHLFPTQHPVVLCGDLFHPEWERVLAQVSASASQTLLCHWQSDDTADLSADGEYQLHDSETGEQMTVLLDDTLRERYAHARQTWYAEVQATCRQLGVRYVAVPPTTPFMAVMAEVVQ